MLKPLSAGQLWRRVMQPPSGGCVLKQYKEKDEKKRGPAAAFGRLCVETRSNPMARAKHHAAAFGRLCVETGSIWNV